MLNTLLKKQMMEMNQSFFQNKKTGKKRSRTAMLASMMFFAFVMVFIIGGLFIVMSLMLSPLIEMGVSWMYFLIMAAVATGLGIFGSVFNTYSTLYHANDNDLLLSLPIPVRYILLTRLTGVYMIGLMYSMIVFIPAIIIYLIKADLTPATVAGPVIFALNVSVFVFILSCILGWIVGSVSAKLKNKSLARVAIALLFIGVYYVVYFNAKELTESLIANADAISSAVMSRARALYFIGTAAAGNMKALIAVTLTDAAILALVMFVIAKTFMVVATSSGGTSYRASVKKHSKVRSVHTALLHREFSRFTSSSTYMLNCAMGTIFMILAAAACIIKKSSVMGAAEQLGFRGDSLTVIVLIGICAMMSANNISAPSISMEGANLWIIRSLPVRVQDILRAKLILHIIVTVIPAILCAACMCTMSGSRAAAIIILMIAIIAYSIAGAAFGLIMNIKNPNMSWTSETVAVKQNFSVAAVMFGGWIVMAVIAGLYFMLRNIVPAIVYLAACAAAFSAAAAVLYKWIMTKGVAEFEKI